jgi:hypothetical protein
MAAGPKLVADRTEHRTEARSVPQALEPLQTSLTLPDELVRVLDAIVLAPAAAMGDGRHHDGFRRRVSRQPIAHYGARHHPESLQEFAQETLCGECAPAALHQDVRHLARVINGAPQSAALAIDHQTEFIEVPEVRAGPLRSASVVGRTPCRTAGSRGGWLRERPLSVGPASTSETSRRLTPKR